MSKRIYRKKLQVENKSNILSLSIDDKLIIDMDEGFNIDVSDLKDNLFDSYEIVKELNIFLLDQSAKRGVANIILRFLRFSAEKELEISASSLLKYKKYLDRQKIKLNSKGSFFSPAKAFTKHLMSSGIISWEELPVNFKSEEPVHKKTFIDPIRYDLDEITKKFTKEVKYWITEKDLKKPEAQALTFGLACMSALKEAALAEISSYAKDSTYVESIIESITEEDESLLKNVDFSKLKNHSEIQAVKFLYINYGRALPTKGWEKTSDWWRKKANGWSVTRIRSAFFPTIMSLEPYFILTLADEKLCPNVDGVRKYMYLDCCVPSIDNHHFDFFIGKSRGSSNIVSIDKNDDLVTVIRALIKRLKRILPEMPGGYTYLDKEMSLLFVHFYRRGRKKGILKTIDASTSSYLVKRFIKRSARNYSVLEPLIDRVSGENFRPTHSYLKSLLGQSIYQIQNDLHHKNTSTTRSYIKGVETQLIINRKKKEFQNFLINEANTFKSKRTGSGYFCDFKNEQQNNCIQYLACIDCEAKRIIFDSVELTAEWISWEKKIINDENRLRIENSERWDKFWKPKLVEYQFLISQVNKMTLESAKKIKLELPCID